MKTFLLTLLLSFPCFAQYGSVYPFTHNGKKYLVSLNHTYDEIRLCDAQVKSWNGKGLGPCGESEIYNLLAILQRINPGDETTIESMVATIQTCSANKGIFFVLLDKAGCKPEKDLIISEVRSRY